MRRRTIRLSQADLNASALRQAHEFQRVAVQSLLDADWNVSSITPSAKGNRMITMRHAKDGTVCTAVYPDGSWARSKTPTIKWEWSRVDRQAEATVPDAYVANILAKQAA
jgi:hypothetical protein